MDKCFDDHNLAVQLFLPEFESLDVCFSTLDFLVTKEKIEAPGNQMLLPFYPTPSFYPIKLELPYFN